jgi:hypothetical protein
MGYCHPAQTPEEYEILTISNGKDAKSAPIKEHYLRVTARINLSAIGNPRDDAEHFGFHPKIEHCDESRPVCGGKRQSNCEPRSFLLKKVVDTRILIGGVVVRQSRRVSRSNPR